MMKLFVMIMMIRLSLCDDTSSTVDSTRSGRFLKFQTRNEDIVIDMEFKIPFVTIPVKRALDSTFGYSDIISNLPEANVNIGALALGSVIILATTFLIPYLAKSTMTEDTPGPNRYHFRRVLENIDFEGDNMIKYFQEVIHSNPGAVDCVSRILCWSSHKENNFIAFKNLTEMEPYIVDIIGNPILENLLNGTSIMESIRQGNEGRNCAEIYPKCPVTKKVMKAIMILLRSFVNRS